MLHNILSLILQVDESSPAYRQGQYAVYIVGAIILICVLIYVVMNNRKK
ncbi:MAG: hypothetical protein WAM70_01045 [Pyrinomonadaceae bacterium]